MVFLLAAGFCPLLVWAAGGNQSAPKLLNLYLGWEIKDQDLKPLAQWDLVVLDMDMQWQAPEKMRILRQENPRLKILAYVSAGELAAARGTGDHASPGCKLSQLAGEDFYMHDAQGGRLSWWPGAYLMNVTNLGPRIDGRRWNQTLPNFIRDEIMSTGLWDGVFLDAAFSDVAYFFGDRIDADANGRVESAASINSAWQQGMSRLIQNVRQAVGADKIVMNNSSAAYATQVNGVLFENFPRFGWTQPFSEFQSIVSKNIQPSVTAINTNTNNIEAPQDYRLMRYGLASALMADGYFSFDAGDRGHERVWWYDEYNVFLGAAQGSIRRLAGTGAGFAPGVWLREYERGIVVVNSDQISRQVNLPGTFEKLRGIQDPTANDGSLAKSLKLPAQDGLILLRATQADAIKDSAFINGQFVKVYAEDGTVARNGFFAERSDASAGARVIVSDMKRTGSDAVVSATRGAVTLRSVDGKTTQTIRPFGRLYAGEMFLAVGNADRDAALEIIVGRGRGGSSEIKVMDLDGGLLAHWRAYGANFKGGVRVALGDLDGDGLREIVSAAGPGGGPHIRIWKTDGQVWGGGFFAFNAHESGGVSVAVGDVNGDNRDEIVAGSGEGARPRVRVFDFRGTLKQEFALGDKPILNGLEVSVADLNGDGMKEILVGGLPIF